MRFILILFTTEFLRLLPVFMFPGNLYPYILPARFLLSKAERRLRETLTHKKQAGMKKIKERMKKCYSDPKSSPIP